MAMADSSPGGSPLSTLSSDAFEAEEEQDAIAVEAPMRPAKRQKLGDSSMDSMRASTPHHLEDDGFSSIALSSDTEGDIPNSPSNLRPEDDEAHEQVTVCSWEACDAGDLGDMDKLVDHIHNEHIETRGKKYTCEWSDCNRKGMPHASAYALKSHMRSHTREKPFYCTLPECDRAFTRSDALAKHHRTVHETEALRPSDPIPKSMQTKARLKNIMQPPEPQVGAQFPEPSNGVANGSDRNGWTSSFPTDLGFTPEEESRGPQELWRLLRRQLHWAEEETESLKRQCEMMEELRKQEWLEKEILLDQTMKNEISWHIRRSEVLAGRADLPSADEIKVAAERAFSSTYNPSSPAQPSSNFVHINGHPVADQREAANVLASFHNA